MGLKNNRPSPTRYLTKNINRLATNRTDNSVYIPITKDENPIEPKSQVNSFFRAHRQNPNPSWSSHSSSLFPDSTSMVCSLPESISHSDSSIRFHQNFLTLCCFLFPFPPQFFAVGFSSKKVNPRTLLDYDHLCL